MDDDWSPAVMYDNGATVVANDHDRSFDRKLNRFGSHGIRCYGCGFCHATYHPETQHGGDYAVSQSFRHFVVVKNRH
jgi:hypothetical protein